MATPDDPAFRELFIRWFQYGTFNPILRVHGTRNPDENELWSYGPDAQTILVNFDRLRYRMLPYIYSLAWKTTSEALHADAAAGHGFPHRCSALRISATSSCSARHS